MVLLITSSLAGCGQLIATIIQLGPRDDLDAPSVFVWAQFVTSSCLLAFPLLEAMASSSCPTTSRHLVLPAHRTRPPQQQSKLDISGRWKPAAVAAPVLVPPSWGASWFSPGSGYRGRSGQREIATFFYATTTMMIWAHMYHRPPGTKINVFFRPTTISSIPSVIICRPPPLWDGSISGLTHRCFLRCRSSRCFGVEVSPPLPLELNASDIYLHDSILRHRTFPLRGCPGNDLWSFSRAIYSFGSRRSPGGDDE